MTSKLPKTMQENMSIIKICVICEGNEEYEYLKKLISLHI